MPEPTKQLPKFKVCGQATIVGDDGKSVFPGGTVELDPDLINIDALVVAGCVEPVDEKPAKADQKSAAAKE